jgi:hypothetical protein
MTSRSTSIPAPLGGWNARDSIANMAPDDAVALNNFFPGTTDIIMRKGYSRYATGFGSEVTALMPYLGGSTQKLFAAENKAIYDITSTGAIGAAVVSSLTNTNFISVNMSTTGGNFLMMVNSADKLQGYDGTNWWVDGDATHDITGFDTKSASFIFVGMHRLWFIDKNTLNLYYLGTDSIAGAASKFSLQDVAREGGYLVAIGAWTIDAGYGVEDLTVFVTNLGEIIVYGGTDPSDVTTWFLRGVWKVGSPIGSNCLFKFAGDLLYISQDGLVPLSSLLQSDRLNPKVFLTNKIQWAISTAITAYGGNTGWQTIYYPSSNMLLLNVPKGSGLQEQYVMNTITMSWGRFTGYNANCWVLYEDVLYFGSNGYVGQAWNTFADNGGQITANCAQAYSYFGFPGAQKRFTMAKPIMLSSGLPAVGIVMNTDYNTTTYYTSLSFSNITLPVWDTAKWDVDVWAGDLAIIDQWQGINGIGLSAGLAFQIQSSGIENHWVSTEVVFEVGGVL